MSRGSGVTKYFVSVDPKKSIEQALQSGRYKCIDPDITGVNFPHIRFGYIYGVDVRVVHYGITVTTDEVRTDLDRRGLRPAPLFVGAALCNQYPRLQKKASVVILGTKWSSPGGFVCVPVFTETGGKRTVVLEPYDCRWCKDCSFAAIPK